MLNLDDPRFATWAWIGIAALALTVVVTFLLGRWDGGLVLTGFLIASVGFVRYEDRLPCLFDLLFVAAAVLNGLGYVFNLFPIGPYDELAHFYTTFALTLSLGFLFYYSLRSEFRAHRHLFVLAIASFGCTVGVFWEFFEWATGIIGSLGDTLGDLAMDALGAGLAALLAGWAIRRYPEDELSEQDAAGAPFLSQS